MQRESRTNDRLDRINNPIAMYIIAARDEPRLVNIQELQFTRIISSIYIFFLCYYNYFDHCCNCNRLQIRFDSILYSTRIYGNCNLYFMIRFDSLSRSQFFLSSSSSKQKRTIFILQEKRFIFIRTSSFIVYFFVDSIEILIQFD